MSSIDFDDNRNFIICGNYKNLNNTKCYNLIIYSIENENINDNCLSNTNNVVEKLRKSNVHQSDIMIVKYSKDGYILTGSNDKNIKIWN